MHDWLTLIADHSVNVINAMALIIIVFGSVQAFVATLQAMASRGHGDHIFHPVYIHYARWLVAGLTFQLAADIIETAFSPSWEEIGKLAAIAAIRTFINFFLERDLAEEERRVSGVKASTD